MQQKVKWFLAVVLWSCGCSHTPGLAAEAVSPQPSAQVATADRGPEAQVIEKEFDFGEMTEDGAYVHEFSISNSGTGALEITRVMPA
jgi:hypothetical protein